MNGDADGMNFQLDETEQAVADLAEQILGDESTPDRLREVESDKGFDASTWSHLAAAGLVAIGAPEALGGGGLGLLAAGEIAKAVGRHTAAVPFIGVAAALDTLLHADPNEDFDVAGVLAGSPIVVPALDLGPDPATTRHPSVVAVESPEGWTLTGEISAVPFGAVADRFVVPATLDGGRRVVLIVPADAVGLTAKVVRTTALLPAANLSLRAAQVPAAAHVGDGSAVDRLVDVSRLLGCRAMSGVSQGALALAATYTSEREQFGSKIGTFQAVAHRLADAYVDGQAIELTGLEAVWRAEQGESFAKQLDVACFWASEGGQRIVHAAQHVHGGIGVDTDYPLHRYFRWAKELELQLGGAERSLVELGGRLAATPG